MSAAPFRSEVLLADVGATLALGETIGRHLRPGQALALIGDLGAGKTTLARGVARGLGVDDPDAVSSPTYLLVVEHEGPLPMVHVDAYLPDKTRAFLLDGGLDYLHELGGVVVVEWADRIAELLPAETVELRLDPAAGGRMARLSGGAAFSWIASLGRAPERGGP